MKLKIKTEIIFPFCFKDAKRGAFYFYRDERNGVGVNQNLLIVCSADELEDEWVEEDCEVIDRSEFIRAFDALVEKLSLTVKTDSQ